MQHPRQDEVVPEPPAAGHVPRRLLAADARAYVRRAAHFTASTIWENTNMKNKFNSSVLHNGFVYGLDEGILVCLDVNTGERKWKDGRYGYGQVILAGDHLIVSSDKGDVALVKATPAQYTEVARFTAVQGQTWNYPAIAGGRLLVRNSNEMAAYDISGK